MFDAIIEQDTSVIRLLSMFANDAIPHALLLTGISGIGKKTAAQAFAMALNCQTSSENKASGSNDPKALFPCMTCRSCRKLSDGVHPDLLRVEPAGSMIKIAQIRELCSKLLVKPYESKTRVVIIHDAHLMNAESSNALLKSLEEPPGSTLFILVSDRPSDLLPTILSRCQQVGFNPVSTDGIKALLIDRGIDAQRAGVLAAMADGSVGKALTLSEKSTRSKQLMSFRTWILSEIEALSNGSLTSCLLFAEKLAVKKDTAIEALDFMLSAVRDLIVLKFTPEKIQNKDLETELIRTGQRYSVPKLLSMSAHIQKAQKDIQSNAALRLCLDVMVFNLLRV